MRDDDLRELGVQFVARGLVIQSTERHAIECAVSIQEENGIMYRAPGTLIIAAQLLLVTALAACGGGNSSNNPPPTYSIGGAVTGLVSGRSVVLQNNGVDNLTLNANGAFTFATKMASGGTYAVTVLSQPTGETCTVASGSAGLLAGNVDTVAISCTNLSDVAWTWVSGASRPFASGVYGTLGTGAAANVPGARGRAISWADSAGSFWLFGGYGHDSTGANGDLNDLWKYTPSTQQWTWVSGANMGDASGTYGTLGIGSTANVPGARDRAIAWTDSDGSFWLFGGYGHDSTGANGDLNDLWKYTPSTQQWTWISGANTGSAPGTYGTLGIGSTANVPGARDGAISWTDSAGNLWLFGGSGIVGTEKDGSYDFTYFNDLWMYTPSTQQWTWMSGANTGGASGIYGSLGTGSTANVPGSRSGAISWTDGAGNFWLFGGSGYDSTQIAGYLNDLWEYTPSTQQWTWVSGANTHGASGIYGLLGTGSTVNVPGARDGAISWTDSAGDLWLFGGTPGLNLFEPTDLNDLWKYTPLTRQWTWMSGRSGAISGGAGSYGTLGTGSTSNVPGPRDGAISWTDSAGNLWLFGGRDADDDGAEDLYNDLWRCTIGEGLGQS